MTKAELVSGVALEAGITKSDAESAVNAVLSVIKREVKSGGEVSLVGFGKFSKQHKEARDGRNPSTGATIKIPAKDVAKFKISPNFLD